MTATKMVECEPCRGTGFAPYAGRLRCGTCHGAGEYETWDDEPDQDDVETTTETA